MPNNLTFLAKDIAMPLPLILGAAALVTAAYGAKKGYDGYQKHSEADEIVDSAKTRYEMNRRTFDEQEKNTTKALESLGQEELRIGHQFNEFKTLAEDILQKLNNDRLDKLEINIPQHKLQKVEGYSYTAIGVLGAAAGAGGIGAVAGFAVYGGVMAIGAASTGTAISALSGVAATNATLAAIGGGSLATGGLGMAGGTAILGAAIAGPVLAIAGWAYDNHGEEALNKAAEIRSDVAKAIGKLEKAQMQLSKTAVYASHILDVLKNVYSQFDMYFNTLKAVANQLDSAKALKLDTRDLLAQMSDTIMHAIGNGYTLAAILVDMITTPIFKFKYTNDDIVKDEKGVPVLDMDADGSMILNAEQLDQKLSDTITNAAQVNPA